jgi:hypothetical protein
VYCPRCGTPNEPGDRYCAACGTQLNQVETTEEQRSGRERLAKLIGTDRKSRLITGVTIAAFVVAVVGFIALSADDEDSIPRDRYTLAAERICLSSKQSIVTASGAGGSAYARQLVVIVVSWREQLADLQVPEDRLEQARQLDEALREAEIEVAALARISETGNRARTLASAKRAEAATADVEEAIADLGLSRCARATIGVSPAQ